MKLLPPAFKRRSTSGSSSKPSSPPRSDPTVRQGSPKRKKPLLPLTPLLPGRASRPHGNAARGDERALQTFSLSAADRIFVLSPHPDDETLGCGGLLARASALNLPVHLVFLTNGDGSLCTRLAENVRRPRSHPNKPESFIRMAGMRQKEALAAAARLGVDANDVVFLGYPDGGTRAMCELHWKAGSPYRSKRTGCERSPYSNSRTVAASYCGENALADIRDAISEFQPTLVLTTHVDDTHADHRTSFDLCAAAMEELRSAPNADAWAQQCRLLTFMVHYGFWPLPSGYRPNQPLLPPAALRGVGIDWLSMPLTDSERETKRAALEQYRSQLATTPRYLRSFVRRNELFSFATAEDFAGAFNRYSVAEPVAENVATRG